MKATLAMALHFHQPVGNFDSVIDRACEKCYLPFLRTLGSYPDVKMTLHFTGCLLEWAQYKKPEVLEHVRGLVSAGQVEIMTGGFYEPILVSIPEVDRQLQIRMLSEYVKKNFSYEPIGAWVAERVWEPSLSSTFSEAGVKYIVLDDTHFMYAGLRREEVRGYYITEDNWKKVAVFPSDKTLRYHIPFKLPGESLAYMRQAASDREDALFVYGDDGEKFGEWPGTHKWVFEEKWLENFFDELIKNSGWLSTEKLSDCLLSRAPSGRIYLPTSSYEEMLEWSLPADMQEQMKNVTGEIIYMGKEKEYKPFIRGGFWRNFFTKYPESNHMNKKMAHVSRKLDKIRSGDKEIFKDKKFKEAERELCKAQCNCAYWHGVFGGLYLYHLRNAVYEHIIRSESLADSLLYGSKGGIRVYAEDIDADGREDIIMENNEISLIISPSRGGAVKEIDSRGLFQNYVNSLSRKKEAYHKTILEKIRETASENGEVRTIHDGIQTADPGLKDHMRYDRYPRHCFIDHFLAEGVDINSFAACRYEEKSDIARKGFSAKTKKTAGGAKLLMSAEVSVLGKNLLLEKNITLPVKGASFSVDYTIHNKSASRLKSVFASESNITMRYADSPSYDLDLGKSKIHKLSDMTRKDICEQVKVSDQENGESLSYSFKTPCELWHFPVRTVSQSEKAYELNYQCSAIVPVWKIDIGPGEKTTISIEIKLCP